MTDLRLDRAEKLYCIMMMMDELRKLTKSPGDTRVYLSLDDNDKDTLTEALLALGRSLIR